MDDDLSNHLAIFEKLKAEVAMLEREDEWTVGMIDSLDPMYRIAILRRVASEPCTMCIHRAAYLLSPCAIHRALKEAP